MPDLNVLGNCITNEFFFVRHDFEAGGPILCNGCVGYFVLFSSTKAQGGIRLFGQVLAVWIFVIALMPPLAGAYITLAGLCPMTEMMRGAD